MRPSFTFSLDKNVHQLVVESVRKVHPSLCKENALILFIESLLASIYSHYQPQDIKFQALQNSRQSGFFPFPIRIDKMQANHFIDSNTNDILRHKNHALDFIFKKLLFQYANGIEQYTDRSPKG